MITSTGSNDDACFLSGGLISFSRSFWNNVRRGENLLYSYLLAKQGIAQSCTSQIAEIDTGDGTSNEARDSAKVADYEVGSGIRSAANGPSIGLLTENIILSDGTKTATIWVEDVQSTCADSADCVLAVVTPPWAEGAADITEVPLLPVGADNYRYEKEENFVDAGIYNVAIYVQGTLVKQMTVTQLFNPDNYEVDDTYVTANSISVNANSPQQHNFHYEGPYPNGIADEDWVKFYGLSGESYEIKASNLGGSNIVLEVYKQTADGTIEAEPIVPPVKDNLSGLGVLIPDFSPVESNTYYIRASQDSDLAILAPGENTLYELSVKTTTGDFKGCIEGRIFDPLLTAGGTFGTNDRLGDVVVRAFVSNAEGNGAEVGISSNSGNAMVEFPSNSGTFVKGPGYGDYTVSAVPQGTSNLYEIRIDPVTIDGVAYLGYTSDPVDVPDSNRCYSPVPFEIPLTRDPGGGSGDCPGAKVDLNSANTYATLLDAYNVTSGDNIDNIIQLQATTFTFPEGLLWNDTNSVTLRSGYDCNYTSNAGGTTTIQGNMTISSGTVVIESGTLQIIQ
jgi:hypothetical protein